MHLYRIMVYKVLAILPLCQFSSFFPCFLHDWNQFWTVLLLWEIEIVFLVTFCQRTVSFKFTVCGHDKLDGEDPIKFFFVLYTQVHCVGEYAVLAFTLLHSKSWLSSYAVQSKNNEVYLSQKCHSGNTIQNLMLTSFFRGKIFLICVLLLFTLW